MPRSDRLIALTFDDGPSRWTPPILDLLAKHGARATFFVLGESIAGNEHILERALREGHELGLHSWSHPHLTELSVAEATDEMLKTQAVIESASGVVARIWRAPYLETDERLREALAEAGLVEAGCTISPEDYHWPAERTVTFVKERLQPGAILDLHDGRREGSHSDPIRTETVVGLTSILRELDERGLRGVPVSELSFPGS